MNSQREKPKPIGYTLREDNDWIDWINWDGKHRPPNHPQAHAIKFSDGSIFDMIGGWRKERKEHTDASIEKPSDVVLCLVLEKIELACRRTAARCINESGDSTLLNLASEIAKIIKDHRS